jgi:hypothetical protein
LIHFMNVKVLMNEFAPELYNFCKYDKRCVLPFQYT